ncbi:HipA domain-containing protein [Zhongshania borealis]|uniref:HipA-like C-terminal domain-containing protein n=1 Tax=Zhongshania borealis TaxID=889488 RepID=A0ABP7W9I7_9GAMM
MELVDVSNWPLDESAGVFPVGARDKEMVWAPESVEAPLRSSWPYLFKESIARYPDQYWTEVVAYIVSTHLGVWVPRTLPAFKIVDGVRREGALIEWFYDVNSDRYISGEPFFKKLIPNFDDKTGRQHNIRDLILILRSFAINYSLDTDYKSWLADVAIFDCLIGNTDRHQENWGAIYKEGDIIVLSPLFDNGTSLGHERFTDRVAGWDIDRLYKYLLKGDNHLRFTRKADSKRINHFSLVHLIANKLPWGLNDYMLSKVESVDLPLMLREISTLIDIKCEQSFTRERYDWMGRILVARHMLLLNTINR